MFSVDSLTYLLSWAMTCPAIGFINVVWLVGAMREHVAPTSQIKLAYLGLRPSSLSKPGRRIVLVRSTQPSISCPMVRTRGTLLRRSTSERRGPLLSGLRTVCRKATSTSGTRTPAQCNGCSQKIFDLWSRASKNCRRRSRSVSS